MLDFPHALADAVKRARNRKKLSQRQLAELLNIGQKTIDNIENARGNPKLETIAVIVRFLNINPMEIFYPETLQPSNSIDQLRMLTSQCTENEAMWIMTVLPNLLVILRKNEFQQNVKK